MAWTDAVGRIDAANLKAFGVPATFTPQNGSGDQQIAGIIQNPPVTEDYQPGSLQGTSVVRFFVRFADLDPQPQAGDHVTINGVLYCVEEPEADTGGGAVLKLRKE